MDLLAEKQKLQTNIEVWKQEMDKATCAACARRGFGKNIANALERIRQIDLELGILE